MEGGIIPLNTILATSAEGIMELDYMDELLLEGCWLEANGSDFSDPISPFEPTIPSPLLEFGAGEAAGSSAPNEVSKRWWFGPTATTSVMDRLVQALGYIKECSMEGGGGALVQVWVPVTREGRRVLTTSEQPFSVDLNCPRLAHYREISVNFQFPTEEGWSGESVGLPGRVFRSRVPEWTPDVRFFTRDEYPRVYHAQQVDVRGTLAVPVLEQGSQNCLGVIEVVLTTQKLQYRPELETVCKALEAVDLGSAQVFITHNVKARDRSYQAALPEILEVLRAACMAHHLPLAQTWVPCILQGKGGCRHSEENLQNCVSPVDSACYIGDSRIHGFHEACSDYHLLKGQGIVGRAFGTNQPCFSPDVTTCSRTEYPLSHHARMFGLKAAVAIRLRSTCTGLADFVLELFLPMNCMSMEEQKEMLTSLSTIIQNVCRTLRVVMDKELHEESTCQDKGSSPHAAMTIVSTESQGGRMQFQGSHLSHVDYQESCGIVSPFKNGKSLAKCEARQDQHDSSSRGEMTFTMDMSVFGEGSSVEAHKTGDRRRMKSEKTITLQVLQQYFAGSLKDAAKKLGVCPTTLKRICRQHGVQRWPSRKIKKVGHSLQKIQRVIDSVQGASGVLHIDTFYSSFPELASPNASRTKSSDNQSPLHKQENNKTGISRSPAATAALPSSSCSQSSNSSQCCSSEAQPSSISFSKVGCQDYPTAAERSDPCSLKRTRTESNVLNPSDDPELAPVSKLDNHLRVAMQAHADAGISHATHDVDMLRIKVSYGEDNIRFQLRSDKKYKDLVHEISRRFGVDDPSSFHLKYLDDDAEWVLLTCDADMEECIDVCRSSCSNTMKLAWHPSSHRRPFYPAN